MNLLDSPNVQENRACGGRIAEFDEGDPQKVSTVRDSSYERS